MFLKKIEHQTSTIVNPEIMKECVYIGVWKCFNWPIVAILFYANNCYPEISVNIEHIILKLGTPLCLNKVVLGRKK